MLPWTAYCTDCLLILEAEKEFVTDELLVRCFQSQLGAEKMSGLQLSTVTDVKCLTNVPAMFDPKSFQV